MRHLIEQLESLAELKESALSEPGEVRKLRLFIKKAQVDILKKNRRMLDEKYPGYYEWMLDRIQRYKILPVFDIFKIISRPIGPDWYGTDEGWKVVHYRGRSDSFRYAYRVKDGTWWRKENFGFPHEIDPYPLEQLKRDILHEVKVRWWPEQMRRLDKRKNDWWRSSTGGAQ